MVSAICLLALLSFPRLTIAGDCEVRSSSEEYVLGRDLYLSLSIDNVLGAVEHLQRAVKIDPANLRAWYTLGDAYRTGMLMVKADEKAWETKSREIESFLLGLTNDPKRAAASDPELLANLVARTKGRAAIDSGSWAEAEAILQRKEVLESDLELNKGRDISYGVFLFSVGRVSDAEYFLARARIADRYAAVTYVHLARVYASNNDYQRSLAVLDEGVNLFTDPGAGIEQRWHPLLRRAALLTALATGDEALIAAKAGQIKSSDLGAGELDKQLATMLGDDQALRRTLHGMWSDPVNRYGYRAESIAVWAAYASDHDLAIAALRRLPNDFATWALWHPAVARMSNAPGYRETIQRTGLLKYWRASGKWGEFCRPVGTRDFQCKAKAGAKQPLDPRLQRG